MEKRYDLSLTLDEINVILSALGEKPYIEVAAVITNIHTQVTTQASQDKVELAIED